MHVLKRLTTAAVLAAATGPAMAQTAAVPERELDWSWDLSVVVPIAIASGFYLAGVMRLYRRLDANRLIKPAQMAAYAGGLMTLFAVLISPLDSVADQLFWVHMIQHLGLMLVAAPLLVIGRPAIAFLWAFGPRGRRRVGAVWGMLGLRRGVEGLMHPLAVWFLFCGVFAVWHFPGPYQLALANENIHTMEHICLLVTALMFWSIVIEPSGRRRLGYGPTLIFIITAAIVSALPGALIALAPRPLYPAHAPGDAAWGFSLLQDQQLAGMVMWIPGGVVYLATASIIFVKWLQQEDTVLARRVLQPVILLLILPLALGGCDDDHHQSQAIGNSTRGSTLISSYGCGGCHTVPGIADATGVVGPPLTMMGRRVYIAGMLRNTPDNMVAWLRNPQQIVPGNVMPDMGLDERDARDVAAYLEILR